MASRWRVGTKMKVQVLFRLEPLLLENWHTWFLWFDGVVPYWFCHAVLYWPPARGSPGDWLCFSLITDCSMDLQCSVDLPAPVAIPVNEGLAPLPSDSDAKGLSTSFPAASLLPSPDCVPLPVPENVEDFTDGDIIGEELDSLLDSLAEGSPYPLVRVCTTWGLLLLCSS